jgi:hypothetical protein
MLDFRMLLKRDFPVPRIRARSNSCDRRRVQFLNRERSVLPLRSSTVLFSRARTRPSIPHSQPQRTACSNARGLNVTAEGIHFQAFAFFSEWIAHIDVWLVDIPSRGVSLVYVAGQLNGFREMTIISTEANFQKRLKHLDLHAKSSVHIRRFLEMPSSALEKSGWSWWFGT